MTTPPSPPIDDPGGRRAAPNGAVGSTAGPVIRAHEQFIRQASHELRTPLTNIRGYVELVLDLSTSMDEVERAHLRTALANADRAARIVDQLLALQRIDVGGPSLAPVDVGLVDLLAPVLGEHRERPGVAHVLDPAVDPAARVTVDVRATRSLVTELLDNAVKFSPAPGPVVLTGAPRGVWAAVEVTSSGPVIPADELPRVFDRFYRCRHAVSQARPGLGVGLTIARATARAQGGDLELHSREARGTTARLWLPLSAG